MDPKGKGALVTGGASGLGKATVQALVARGAKVGIGDKGKEAGEALAKDAGLELVDIPVQVPVMAANIRPRHPC